MTQPDTHTNVVLTADVQAYQQSMQAANASTNQVVSSLDKLSNSIDGVFRKAGRRLELFGAGGIASIGAAVVSLSKLDSAMSKIRATNSLQGGGQTNVGRLREDLVKLSTQIPASARELAALATTVQGLGVRGADNIAKLTKTFAQLQAVTGESGQGLANDIIRLTQSMEGLSQGLEPARIQKYSAEVAHLSANMGTSASSITSFAQAIQPMSRLVGLSQTQLLGLSGAFSKAGADGFAAANAFNQIATIINDDLRTGNPNLKQFADLTGQTVDQFAQLANTNMAEALSQVFDSLNKQGPRAIGILQSLGLDGIRSLNAIQRVTQSGGLRTGINEAIAGGADPSSLGKAASSAFDDLQSQTTKLGHSLEALATGPFVALERALIPIVKAVDLVVSAFVRLADVPGIKQLLQVAGLISPMVLGMIALGGAILTILPRLALLGAAWKAVFSPTGVSMVGGYRDALNGAATSAAGAAVAGGRAGLMARGGYAAGGFIGGAARTYGLGGEGAGPGVVDRLARQGLAATRFAAGQVFGPAWTMTREASARVFLGRPISESVFDRSQGGNLQRGAAALARIPGLGGVFGPMAAGKEPYAGTHSATAASEEYAKATRAATAAQVGMTAATAASRTTQTTANEAYVGQHRAMGVAANSATLSLRELAATAGAAALGTAMRADRALVRGAVGVGSLAGNWASRGLSAVGGFAAANPLMTGLMTAPFLYEGYKSANRTMSGDELESKSGSFIGTLNSLSNATGGTTTSMKDLTDAASKAAGALKPNTKAWSDEEIALAQDASFKAVGYDKNQHGDAAKLASLLESQSTLITKGGKPLSDAEQTEFRKQLLHLLPVDEAKKVYADFSKSTGQFSKASTDMSSTTSDFKALGASYIDNMKQQSNPLRALAPWKSTGSQTALDRITGSLNLLNQQSLNAATPADQAAFSAQFASGLLGAGQSAGGTHVYGYANPRGAANNFFKDMAGKLGVDLGGRTISSTEDFVNAVYDKDPETAKRLWGEKGSIDWSNPGRAQQQIQTRADAAARQQVTGQPNLRAQEYDTFNLRGAGLAFGSPGAEAAGRVMGGTVQPGKEAGTTITAVNALSTSFSDNTRSAAANTAALEIWAASIKSADPNVQALIASVRALAGAMNDIQTSTMTLPDQIKSWQDEMAATDKNDVTGGGAERYKQLQQNLLGAQGSIASQAQQYLIARHQLNIQISQGAEDYNKQVSRSTEQFNKQQRRAAENNNIQIARSTEDYYTQRARSQEQNDIQIARSMQSFNTQTRRSTEDFYLSMLYAQQDYQKSQARSTREFVHQEQLYIKSVAQSLDPWAQVQARSVTDAAQAMANVRQQNQMFAQAARQLSGLRGMGVSQNVIDVMGLSDPKNMQQLNRFFVDLAQNPALVDSFNNAIEGRLDWTAGLSTNESSTQWQEMKRQFEVASGDAADDFIQSSQRASDAFARQQRQAQEDFYLMLAQNTEDFDRMTAQSDADFYKMLAHNADDFARMTAQSEDDFAVQMSQMADDYHLSVDRAMAAIDDFAIEAYGKAQEVLDRAMSQASGNMKLFFAEAEAQFRSIQIQLSGQGVGAGGTQTPGESPDFAQSADMNDHDAIMRQALGIAGMPATDQNLFWLNKLIVAESGWNPTAINNWDSNAAAGHPSQGLMQTIPSTFSGNRDPRLPDSITDPLANIVAGLNYIKGRYGSIMNLPGVVSMQGGRGWVGYAEGGLFSTGRKTIDVGERGPEMVLPLNGRGVEFLLSMARQLNSDAWGSRNSASYATRVAPTIMSTTVDSSTNFTGPVTVQAQDPNQMAFALKQKARMAALTRPELAMAGAP